MTDAATSSTKAFLSLPSHKHALIIGKFYPPHKGHMHMIEEAAKKAGLVTVLVYGTQFQHIPLSLRVQWIRETIEPHYPNVNIQGVLNDMYEDYDDENVWEAHDRILQAKLRELDAHADGKQPIDLIVSSEPYGDVMAKTYFGGIDSFIVDQARVVVPISGTACRDDLFGHWRYLPTAVRAGLIPRVIVLGAESTGTTTLALDIAKHYGARYIPEYGREYTEDWLKALQSAEPDATVDDLIWSPDDFEKIGGFQTVIEERAAAQLDGFPLVVGDTDALATAIFESMYLEEPYDYTLTKPYARNLPRRDLYIITDHKGVAFENDGLRVFEERRGAMTAMFEDVLIRLGQPFTILTGSPEDRLHMATVMIDRVLRERTRFE